MFVFSFKSKKSKILASIIILLFIFFSCLYFLNNNNSFATSSIGKYSLRAQTNYDRIDFLSQFGWQVSCEPIEVYEVVIPEQFNQVYENYNKIQKEQGLDLSKYCGKSCIRYTYEILNYKETDQKTRANILIFEDKVIGGDVCSVELNGFMHGFVKSDQKSEIETFNPIKRNLDIPKSSQTEETIQTTFRENLNPDEKMPIAPVD